MTMIKYARLQGRALSMIEAESFDAAKTLAGLNPLEVDHGSIGNGLAIVVGEYSLYDKPADHHVYFACDGHLYAGAALFYQCDDAGETIDLASLETIPPLTFFDDVAAIEKAIQAGAVKRPHIGVTVLRGLREEEVTWQWPQERPK